MAKLRSFLPYTSVHGFKNLDDTDSIAVRVIWLLLIGFSLGGLAVQITHLVRNYYNEPTSTSISIEIPDRFPPMVFCPSSWENTTAMESYGVDNETFEYLKTIFTVGAGRKNAYKRQSALIHLTNHPNYSSVISRTRETLQVIIDKHAGGSLDRFIYKITRKPRDVVDVGVFGRDGNLVANTVKVWSIMTLIGPCIRISDKRIFGDLHVVGASSAELIIRVKLSPDGTKADNILALGDTADTIAPRGEVHLTERADYTVLAGYTHIKHANIRSNPCHDGDYSDTVDHFFSVKNKCIYETCKNVSYCYIYVPRENHRLESICNQLHLYFAPQSERCIHDDERDKAFKDCIKNGLKRSTRPCTIKTYETIATPSPIDPKANYSEITIRFLDPMNRFYFEEKVTYDAMTMISHIGGAIGLWCGASIISLLEVAYFFTCRHRFMNQKNKY